jgi:hypothetical protein
MFQQFNLNFANDYDIFDELSKSTVFENLVEGRQGANLIDHNNNLIPLVRTTTIYNNSVQPFLPIHYNIINKIKEATNKDLLFNNAMIEIYDEKYTKMRYHTDQSLDLQPNSFICIFLCYHNFLSYGTRKLKINSKETNLKSKPKKEKKRFKNENEQELLN